MKKFSCALFALFLTVSLVAPTLADTIRLKDGSIIRGQVIGFRDQQFTVLIGAGSKGRPTNKVQDRHGAPGSNRGNKTLRRCC